MPDKEFKVEALKHVHGWTLNVGVLVAVRVGVREFDPIGTYQLQGAYWTQEAVDQMRALLLMSYEAGADS